MRISFDNNFLFTAGRDGTLIIHDIKDRDPRGGVIKRDFGGVLNFSEEILTEKQEMEEFDTAKEQLENELQTFRDPASTGVETNKMSSNA
jgi:cilia- and flagella-associated protein 57